MSKAGEILDELIADEKKGFDFASKWEDLIQYLLNGCFRPKIAEFRDLLPICFPATILRS